ncbi:MAG: tetratricopeptide repeat protein [Deltaproteobacteria bacterium]|nr:tetratricopeptide repeat protein [Deltaproteobacteria bacterium]
MKTRILILASCLCAAPAQAGSPDAGAPDAGAPADGRIEAEGPDRESRIRKGRAYLEQQKYQHALNEFSAVLLEEPGHRDALLGRVRALAGLKDVPKAIQWAEKATALDPDDLEAWELLGSLYLVEYHLDPVRAEGVFRQLLRLDPDSRAAHLQLARALSYQKKIEKAIEYLQAWLDRHPDDLEVQVKLAESLFALGDLDRAAEILAWVLEREPEHTRARDLLDSVRTRQSYSLWLPIAALVAVSLIVFGLAWLRRGRTPKVGSDPDT